MGEILSQSEINSLLNRLPKSDQIASNIGHAAQSAADQPDRVNSELAPAVAQRVLRSAYDVLCRFCNLAPGQLLHAYVAVPAPATTSPPCKPSYKV